MAAIDILTAWFTRNADRWARQTIATLNANGYAVIRLPNPDAHPHGAPVWSGDNWAVTVHQGRVHAEVRPMGPDLRATESQALAAALLAAAHALGATE